MLKDRVDFLLAIIAFLLATNALSLSIVLHLIRTEHLVRKSDYVAQLDRAPAWIRNILSKKRGINASA